MLYEGSVQANQDQPQFAGKPHQHQVHEELVHVVFDLLACCHGLQPAGGRLVLGDQQRQLGGLVGNSPSLRGDGSPRGRR